jgi:hypothetical protein
MNDPSPQWTEHERLDVIRAIVVQTLTSGIFHVPPDILNVFDRIRFLADGSSDFLEFNRQGILKGLSPATTTEGPKENTDGS